MDRFRISETINAVKYGRYQWVDIEKKKGEEWAKKEQNMKKEQFFAFRRDLIF